MPLPLAQGASTLVVRKESFERAGLTRAQIDVALTLTDEEFRVESGLVVIGPVYDAAALAALVEAFERQGLVYFDDFFEMSGNWPEWLALFAIGARG
jgi:hypothetical protein